MLSHCRRVASAVLSWGTSTALGLTDHLSLPHKEEKGWRGKDTRLERGKEQLSLLAVALLLNPSKGLQSCPSKEQTAGLSTWFLDLMRPWSRLPRGLTLLALALGPGGGFPWLDASKTEEPSFRVA